MNQPQDARRAFVEGIRKFDWTLQPPPPEASDVWMYHVLRREAESLVLPDLPAFLDGRYFPTDNDERIAMTGACQAAGRSVAGARLWAAVFDDDPASQPLYRGLAIRAAALAGCGRGADADALSDDDRRMWREHARQWLAAELAAAAEAPPTTRPTTRPTTPPEQRATAARATLAGMLKSPDLAGIRDPSLLQQLPADERAAWTDLWQRVSAAADVQ